MSSWADGQRELSRVYVLEKRNVVVVWCVFRERLLLLSRKEANARVSGQQPTRATLQLYRDFSVTFVCRQSSLHKAKVLYNNNVCTSLMTTCRRLAGGLGRCAMFPLTGAFRRGHGWEKGRATLTVAVRLSHKRRPNEGCESAAFGQRLVFAWSN